MRSSLLIAITAAVAPLAFAATTSIGVATARGSFTVDNNTVAGTATVFDGTTVQTEVAASKVRLQRGIDISLGSDSRGTVYKDHFVVEKGTGQVLASSGYAVQAGPFQITPADANGRTIVALQSAQRVSVSALDGSWNVSRNGLLLARVTPGRSLAFNLQDSGATAPITVTGVVSVDSGHYIITAADTGTRYEITGQSFDNLVGKTATVTGTPDPSKTPFGGASSVLVVSSSKVGAAGAAAAGAAAGGLSTGATVAIIGGVAAAATIGGLAAAGTFSGSSQ